jgi:hypothetical protein
MLMDDEPPDYHSYLLRLWRTSRDGNAIWHASLESAQTGEQRGFADLASLVAFLEQQTGSGSIPNEDPPFP